jgi:hypothetical protein
MRFVLNGQSRITLGPSFPLPAVYGRTRCHWRHLPTQTSSWRPFVPTVYAEGFAWYEAESRFCTLYLRHAYFGSGRIAAQAPATGKALLPALSGCRPSSTTARSPECYLAKMEGEEMRPSETTNRRRPESRIGLGSEWRDLEQSVAMSNPITLNALGGTCIIRIIETINDWENVYWGICHVHVIPVNEYRGMCSSVRASWGYIGS